MSLKKYKKSYSRRIKTKSRSIRRSKNRRSKNVRRSRKIKSRNVRRSKKRSRTKYDGIKKNIGICEKCTKEKVIKYGFENLCEECYDIYEKAGYKSLINTVQKYELDLPESKRNIKKSLYDMVQSFKDKYRFEDNIFSQIKVIINNDYKNVEISKISNKKLKEYQDGFDTWNEDDIIKNIKKDISPIISFFEKNKNNIKADPVYELKHFDKIDNELFIRKMCPVDTSIYRKYNYAKIDYLSEKYNEMKYNELKDIYNFIFEKIRGSLITIKGYLNTLTNLKQILLCVYIIITGIYNITFNDYDISLYGDKYDKLTKIDYKVSPESYVVTRKFIKDNNINLKSYYVFGFATDEDGTLSLKPIKIDDFPFRLMVGKDKGIVTTGKIHMFNIEKKEMKEIKLKNFLLDIEEMTDKKERVCKFILNQKDGFTMLCDEDIKYWDIESKYNMIDNDPPYYKIVVPGGCLFCGKQDSSSSQNGTGNKPKICIVCCTKKLYPDDTYVKHIEEQDTFLNISKDIYNMIITPLSKGDYNVDILNTIKVLTGKPIIKEVYDYEEDKNSIGTYSSKVCVVCNKGFGDHGNVAYNIHYDCASQILAYHMFDDIKRIKDIWDQIDRIRKDVLLKHIEDIYVKTPIIKKIYNTITNFKESGENYYCDLCSCHHTSSTNNKLFSQFIYKQDMYLKNYECVEFNIKKSYLLKEDGTVVEQDRYPTDLGKKLDSFFYGLFDLKNPLEILSLYQKSPEGEEGFFQKFKKEVPESLLSSIFEFLPKDGLS